MTEARTTPTVPLNHRLRFITLDGRKNVTAIAAAIEARADYLSSPIRCSASIYRDEFATFTRMDWLRIAAQEITAQVDGEMQTYSAAKNTRSLGLPTVADQVHGSRAPVITLQAAE